jgi:molybdenum cofactor biosynthesis enzyme MoaA
VTDRCDLRCTHRLPKGFKGFEEPAHWLNHEEVTRLVAFAEQQGFILRLIEPLPVCSRCWVTAMGPSDAQQTEAILAGMAAKAERHEFKDRPDQVVHFMAQTGG